MPSASGLVRRSQPPRDTRGNRAAQTREYRDHVTVIGGPDMQKPADTRSTGLRSFPALAVQLRDTAAGSGNLLLGAARERVRAHVQLHPFEVTVAEDLHQFTALHEPRPDEIIHTDRATVRKSSGQLADVHALELDPVAVLETAQLGQPHLQRHLATLETRRHRLAGLGPLGTPASGLTLGCFTTSDPDFVTLGARSRPQIMNLDGHAQWTSSTSTRWWTVLTKPRTTGSS